MLVIKNLLRRKPKLVALFAYRYDQQLVPDLLKNIESFIDGYISYDDTKNTALWLDEGKVRTALVEKARAQGYDWVLGVDPDERFELNAGSLIRNLLNGASQKTIFAFNLRELWTPTSYRVDNIWGRKRKPSLFPLLPGQKFMHQHVHSVWYPINEDYQMKHVDINVYHLKMIDPIARRQRVELYKKIDPGNKIQTLGYDYLIDEQGMQLEDIPQGREYLPVYRADYQIRQVK